MANFLPFEKFTLSTLLSIEDVYYTLLNNVNTGPDAWRNSDVFTGKYYYGSVNKNSFIILPVEGWPSKLTIFIKGKIIADNNGNTYINVVVQPDFLVAGIIAGFMVLIAIALLIADILLINDVSFIFLPCIILFIPYASLVWSVKRKSRKAKLFLKSILGIT